MTTVAARRKPFGPLLYATLALAAVSTAGVAIWRAAVWWGLESRRAAEVGPDEVAAAHLAGLGSADPRARVEAVVGLGAVLLRSVSGDASSGLRGQAVRALREALRDEDANVRTTAAHALGGVGNQGRAAADDLRAALGDNDQGVRLATATALIRLADDPGPALRVLGDLLADPALEPPRAAVVEAMCSAGEPGESAASERIARMLSDRDEGVRLDGVDALDALGEAGRRVAPEVESLWASPDPRVRFTTALATLKLPGPVATPDDRVIAALQAAVADPSLAFSLREKALGLLYTLAPASLRRCGRDLARQLDLDDGDARLAAAVLLHMIDPETLAAPKAPALGR